MGTTIGYRRFVDALAARPPATADQTRDRGRWVNALAARPLDGPDSPRSAQSGPEPARYDLMLWVAATCAAASILSLWLPGAMIDSRRWIVVGIPFGWLALASVTSWLRHRRERRMWSDFAAASWKLMRSTNVADIAHSGAEDALRIFGATRATITLHGVTAPGGVPYPTFAAGKPVTAGAAPLEIQLGSEPDNHIGVLTLYDWSSASSRNDALEQTFVSALGQALSDATASTRLRALQERPADLDDLTQLLTREAWLRVCEDSRRRGLLTAPIAMLLIDIDGFREINNTLGHVAGDELLQLVAARLVDTVGDGTLLGRAAGDEFGLLLTGLSPGEPEQKALRFARRISSIIGEPANVAGIAVGLSTTTGVAWSADGREDIAELLRRADTALYHAKSEGALVAAYRVDLDHTGLDRLSLVSDLRLALGAPDSDDELRLTYEPIVDLTTGAAIGVEALPQWHHPRQGLLTPDRFMRVVEASDQLGPFARRLLNRAVAAVAEWRRQGVDLPVSVPISARLLLDETLANDVRDLLDRHGVPATNLILEISETVVMSDLRIVDEVLAGLAALGVQLSVDDFGTGYSSLTFLTRIAVDEIKVDRQFVREMDTSPAASAIVSTFADLGRRLGLRIVADGVETAEQRWQLARLGVTGAQGPAVARTEPEGRILATLRQLSPPPDGIAESPSGRATA